ncbi:MAG: hypothetical protein SF028_10160 [Candidatus Sumerlaeia bacterium]|nr:hypothetical protein [Candidatus Sumerlaeia bacterium]
MRRLLPVLAATLLAAATAPAEETERTGATVLGYLKDRGHDLMDLARLRGGIPQEGKGLGVKARATSLAQAGYVQFRGDYYGMERRALGITRERRTEGGLSLLYGSLHQTEFVGGNSFLSTDSKWSMVEDRRILKNLPYWDDGRRRFFGFGAEVATPVGAIDAGVYPEEALDFVLGWVGIDLFDDDEQGMRDANHYPRATTPRTPDPSAPFAAKRAELAAFDADPGVGAAPAAAASKGSGDQDEAPRGSIRDADADAAIRELNAKRTP